MRWGEGWRLIVGGVVSGPMANDDDLAALAAVEGFEAKTEDGGGICADAPTGAGPGIEEHGGDGGLKEGLFGLLAGDMDNAVELVTDEVLEERLACGAERPVLGEAGMDFSAQATALGLGGDGLKKEAVEGGNGTVGGVKAEYDGDE